MGGCGPTSWCLLLPAHPHAHTHTPTTPPTVRGCVLLTRPAPALSPLLVGAAAPAAAPWSIFALVSVVLPGEVAAAALSSMPGADGCCGGTVSCVWRVALGVGARIQTRRGRSVRCRSSLSACSPAAPIVVSRHVSITTHLHHVCHRLGVSREAAQMQVNGWEDVGVWYSKRCRCGACVEEWPLL
jgi:hypothetical protein